MAINSSERFVFYVWNSGGNTSVEASSFGAPAVDTWYQVIASHEDGVELKIRINTTTTEGSDDTAAHLTGVENTTSPFRVGAIWNGGPNSPWDGMIEQVLFLNRLLTGEEKTSLWNNGAGIKISPSA